jgi:hypothetical protein
MMRTVKQMEQKLNAEREKLIELQRAFNAQFQSHEFEEQLFSAEKDAVYSLEQDIVSKRQKPAVDEKELDLANRSLKEGDNLLIVYDSDSKSRSSRRQKIHFISNLQETFSCMQSDSSSRYQTSSL